VAARAEDWPILRPRTAPGSPDRAPAGNQRQPLRSVAIDDRRSRRPKLAASVRSTLPPPVPIAGGAGAAWWKTSAASCRPAGRRRPGHGGVYLAEEGDRLGGPRFETPSLPHLGSVSNTASRGFAILDAGPPRQPWPFRMFPRPGEIPTRAGLACDLCKPDWRLSRSMKEKFSRRVNWKPNRYG